MGAYDLNNSANAGVLQIVLNYSSGSTADTTEAPEISENLATMGSNVTTEALTAGKTVLATFYLCLSLYVMVMNLVELVIIVRIKTTSSTIYIASLAMTDLLMGVFAILPSSISFLLNRHTYFLGEFMCDFTGVIMNTAMFTSLLAVSVITMNRYIALALPLQYKKLSTNQVAYGVTAIVWFAGLTRSLTPYYKTSRYVFYVQIGGCSFSTFTLFGEQELYYYSLLQLIPYSVCFILLILCPTHILVLLSRRTRRTSSRKKYDPSASTRQSSERTSEHVSELRRASDHFTALRKKSLKLSFSRSKSKTKQNERDATLTTLSVILIFLICWSINYFTIWYYFYYLVSSSTPFTITDSMWHLLETLWLLGINANSVFNPVIYLFRNTTFKHELMKMKQTVKGLLCACKGPAHQVLREKLTSSCSNS